MPVPSVPPGRPSEPAASHRRPPRVARWVRFARLAAACVTAAALAACTHPDAPWHLTNVTGHLPDLSFSLVGENGKPIDASAFAGRTTLLYFGYTHCPDVCPETMARLMEVLGKLGPAANGVRVLFVSVDPARDTPAVMRAYADAFDAKHVYGLTGSDSEVESLAKRYRVAYQMEKRDPNGSYEVTHSSAVYIFDAKGHARLLATTADTPDEIASDLRRIVSDAS